MREILGRAWMYGAFKKLMVSSRQMERFVEEHIRPEPGSKILDIGCGLADILSYLPPTSSYTGFDANPDYIRKAQQIHSARNATFRCQHVHAATLEDPGSWDLVLANGVVHHLDDSEARTLFRIALTALRPGGRLVTLDGVYEPGQSAAARWLISRDRGQFVRTRGEYETLAREAFQQVEGRIEHHLLRLPYTHLIMECTK